MPIVEVIVAGFECVQRDTETGAGCFVWMCGVYEDYALVRASFAPAVGRLGP